VTASYPQKNKENILICL